MAHAGNRRCVLRRAVAVLVVVAAVATAAVLADSGPGTSYAASSPWAAAITLLAGFGLISAGFGVSRTAGANGQAVRARRIGALAVAAGLAWLAPVWVGWWDGPAPVRSVAMLVAPFLLPFLAHLVVVTAAPTPRVGRAVVAAAYVTTIVAVLVRALFHHPIRDLHCWANCTVNVFFWRPAPDLVRLTEAIYVWSAVGLTLSAAAIGVRCVLSATTAGRAHMAPVLVPAVLAAVAEGGYVGLLMIDAAEDPAVPRFAFTYLFRAVALIALGAGLWWTIERARRRRRAVGRLVEALGPVADVGTDALVGEGPLGTELGAAARLAIDNEWLRAEALGQLDALRASRARIVAAADESRARIERDLHDGTQQSLVSLLFELRLALAEARETGDAERAERLAHAVGEAERCVAELREIAHGIFPAVLDESGLAAALWTLTDQVPVPVDVGPLPESRLSAVVERTVYAVVTGVVDEAARQGPTGLRIAVHHQQDTVVVEVDGTPEADYLHLVDRVGATGGDLVQWGGCLRAEIPCER